MLFKVSVAFLHCLARAWETLIHIVFTTAVKRLDLIAKLRRLRSLALTHRLLHLLNSLNLHLFGFLSLLFFLSGLLSEVVEDAERAHGVDDGCPRVFLQLLADIKHFNKLLNWAKIDPALASAQRWLSGGPTWGSTFNR